MGVSYFSVVAVAAAFRMSAARAMPALGATAAGFYYWFASPAFGGALHLGDGAIVALRVAFIGIVAVWWVRAQPWSVQRGLPA
jgi:hypothetical protein